MTINRLKKTISVILIVSLIFCNFISFADNIDVNVSGGEGVGYNINGEGGELFILGDLDIKGARVSLWDVEKQELILIRPSGICKEEVLNPKREIRLFV